MKKRDIKEYRAWQYMKTRCYNKNRLDYKNYGGRGIKVCPEWKDNFDQFLADVGYAPGPEYSLDRIDCDKNYQPGNVRWATREIQNINVTNRSDNKVGCRGVNWHAGERKWNARISVKGKRIALGSYDNLEEAIAARKEAEAKYWQPILKTA